MGPAQVAALENCGIKIEEYGEGIVFRDFESFDIIKPEPLQPSSTNIGYEDPLEEATKLRLVRDKEGL